MQSVVTELNETVKTAKVQPPPTTGTGSSVNAAPVNSVDRSRNVIPFGVAKRLDAGESWRDTVAQALQGAAGREVIIQDAFRLGKRTATEKPRPILVKLHSVWDRRAVIGGAWKLSTIHGLKDVYISPDLSLEERRRKTMDRLLKLRTEEVK